MSFSLREQGNYDRISKYLRKMSKLQVTHILNIYAEKGLNVLKAHTPVRSGVTADSWHYEISSDNGRYAINYLNSNVNKGVNIALIIDIGHGTGTGGWVEGLDYISPALRPIMRDLVTELWREVSTS